MGRLITSADDFSRPTEAGPFGSYFEAIEARQIEIQHTAADWGSRYRMQFVPRGKRKLRQWSGTCNNSRENCLRAVALEGWDHPRPPRPKQTGQMGKKESDCLFVVGESADWEQNANEYFERYCDKVISAIRFRFPLDQATA
jgi:hypothetical protein